MPFKGALNLTWAKVYARCGYPLSRFGVFPTICSVNQKQTPKEVIENINNGAILDAEFGALRGIVGDLNSSSQLNILARCQGRLTLKDGFDFDLRLAQRLLETPTAYKKAFNHSLLALKISPTL